MYEQFNCADYGDERPGGHLPAGTDCKAFSKEQAQGEGMILCSGIREVNWITLIAVHLFRPTAVNHQPNSTPVERTGIE
jgi:hypothetical protein